MGLYRRKDSKVWWMSYTVSGRTYYKSTDTENKRLADTILGKIKAEIVEGKYFDKDKSRLYTYDDLVGKFMAEYAPEKRESTQDRYRYAQKHLDKHFKRMTLADITSAVVSDYMQKRKREGAENGTINREFAMLSKAFSLARDTWEWCSKNPCSKVPKLPEDNVVDRWLSENEYQNLLKHSVGYLNNQLTDIILVALFTAIREDNVISLMWNEIDLFRKVITLPAEKMKNGKPLTIPMNETTYNVLLKKSKVRNMTGYVFATENGTKIGRRNLITAFDKVVEKAGIKDFTFHCLRHTAATWAIQSGLVDIYTLKELLGHKDIRSTMRYAHHYPESLRKAAKVLDNYSTLRAVEKEAVSG